MKGYNSIYFSSNDSSEQTGRRNILNQLVANIPQIKSALKFFMTAILICFVSCFNISNFKSIRLYSLEILLWKRLWTYHKTGYMWVILANVYLTAPKQPQ